jgi:hypothetical protein
MRTIGEIRLQNLEVLVAEAGGAEALAERVESSAVYISQVRNRAIDHKSGKPRELGTKLARRIEAAFDKPRGWMDVKHGGTDSPPPPPQPLVARDASAIYGAARPAWPFPNISPERYAQLPELERGRIQGYVEKLLLDYEAGVSHKSHSV